MSPSESGTSSKPPEPATPGGISLPRNFFWRVVVTLLAVETGSFLLVMPWSSLWDWTLLAGGFGGLSSVLRNHYIRGAISGVGLLSLWVGIIEALALTGVRLQPPGR